MDLGTEPEFGTIHDTDRPASNNTRAGTDLSSDQPATQREGELDLGTEPKFDTIRDTDRPAPISYIDRPAPKQREVLGTDQHQSPSPT